MRKVLFPLFLIAAAAMLFAQDRPAESDGKGTWIDVHMHLDGATKGPGNGEPEADQRPVRRGPGAGNPPKRQQRPRPPMDRKPPQRPSPDDAPEAQARSDEGYEAAAKKLIQSMDQAGVRKALVMPPPQNKGQRGGFNYTELKDVVKKYADRLALVGGGGSLNPIIMATESDEVNSAVRRDFRAKAEAMLKDGVVAFGEMTSLHLALQDKHHWVAQPADHPLFLELADIAAENNVAIDLHMEATTRETPVPAGIAKGTDKNPKTVFASIPPFEILLAHNRKARIVWQHIGWDNIGEMTPGLIERLLKDHSNLFIALRVEDRKVQVGTKEPMPNRLVGPHGKISDDWLKILKAHPDRFVIGADEFVSGAGGGSRGVASFRGTWSILDQLPADLAKKIGRTNAERIYNLD